MSELKCNANSILLSELVPLVLAPVGEQQQVELWNWKGVCLLGTKVHAPLCSRHSNIITALQSTDVQVYK